MRAGSSPVARTKEERHPMGGAPLWCGQDSNPSKCQMPVAFDSNQFKNWLQPYDFAPQSQQSSPVAPLSATTTFFWVALLFGAQQDSNPFQCQMPVAFGSNQFKTLLQLYDFAPQSQHSSPVAPLFIDLHLLGGALRWCGGGQFCFMNRNIPLGIIINENIIESDNSSRSDGTPWSWRRS